MAGDTLEVRVLDVKSRTLFRVKQNGPRPGGILDRVLRPYTGAKNSSTKCR